MSNGGGHPTIAEYTTWIRNVLGIPVNYLPDDSPNIGYSLASAKQWVNLDLRKLHGHIGIYPIYDQAVMNLAGHTLLEFAPDQAWPILSASWLGGLATIRTAIPNTVQVGDRILVSGISPILWMQPGRGGQPVNPNAPIYVSSVIDSSNFQYSVNPNPGTAIIAGNAQISEYYFAHLRLQFKLTQFVPGVVSNTSDTGTGVSLVTPHWATGLGIHSLMLMRTPWGRAYLSIAQQYGSTVWGLTL